MERSFDNIEDFLTDESFRSWVLSPTPELERHWHNWLGENQDKKAMVDQSREMIVSLKFKEFSPDPISKQRILDQIKQETKPRKRITMFSGVWVKVAASLLFLVVAAASVYFIAKDQRESSLISAPAARLIQESNRPGERSKLALPDGSTVYLNAGSSLEYPETFDADSRWVKLNGEAFFEVAHDASRPFKVVTESFEVVVLGTRFNINSRLNSPAVALVDGKVRLHASSSDATLELSPNQMAVFDKEKKSFTSTSFDPRYVTGWKDGYLVFREATLDEVMEKLHSWYGMEISVLNEPTAPDWSYTASFRQESLENVLLNMRMLRRFDYRISNDSLFLSFQ